MEEFVRKELENICRNILGRTNNDELAKQLEQVQELYEKLLVLNYMTSRNSKSEAPLSEPAQPEMQQTNQQTTSQQPGSTATHTEKVAPARTVERKPAPNPTPEPENKEVVNESPVSTEELADDKTPEQRLEEVLEKASESTSAPRSSSINERYGTGAITLGLNDRIAFVNHLFGGQQEDLNRVISQINTFESYQEAEDFIEQMIKPDYDWSQKEEFAMRFMDRVKQKFGE